MTTPSGTALGSLLRFAGMICCRFDTEVREETPPLASVMRLFPQWKAMAEAGGLALPLNELECAVRGLADPAACSAAQREYQKLFLSPDLPVPLWESVWLSQEKLLFTEETTCVREWYSRYGLEILHVGTEAEDHLGLELFFCGWLYDMACMNNSDFQEHFSKQPTLDDVEMFMADHLGRWGESCLKLLGEKAETPFWRSFFAVLAPVFG